MSTERLGTWLGAPALAVSLSFVAARGLLGPSCAVVLYVAFNAAFNLPHQYCTWVRVRGDPTAGPAHGWRVACVALAGLCAVALVRADLLGPTNEALLVNFLPYWGLWHLVGQHFGISAALRRRAGERSVRGLRTDRLFFASLFALGVLRFHASGSLEFRVAGSVSRMWRLPIPEGARSAVAVLSAVAFLAVAGAYLAHAWRANPLRARFQAAVALGTFAAFFLCDDLLVTTAAITALHNLHYIGMVRDYQEGRARADGSARPLGKGDVVAASLYSAAVHGVFLASAAAGQVLLGALVALHYLADSRLWRFRRDPSLAKYLNAQVDVGRTAKVNCP